MAITINDTCPHCEANLAHRIEEFDGESSFICGSCGKRYFCVRSTPYPNFTLFVLSKSPEAPGATSRTLERLPAEEEWEEVHYESSSDADGS